MTSHSPVFLVNSRYPLFSATSSGPACSAPPRRHTLSRSYGVNLPSSLTTVLSNALEYSSRPPESVCGTGVSVPHSAAFLGSLESLSSRPEGRAPSPLGVVSTFVAVASYENHLPAWTRKTNSWTSLSFSVPALLKHRHGAGILTSLPSPTPHGLGLGPD